MDGLGVREILKKASDATWTVQIDLVESEALLREVFQQTAERRAVTVLDEGSDIESEAEKTLRDLQTNRSVSSRHDCNFFRAKKEW